MSNIWELAVFFILNVRRANAGVFMAQNMNLDIEYVVSVKTISTEIITKYFYKMCCNIFFI